MRRKKEKEEKKEKEKRKKKKKKEEHKKKKKKKKKKQRPAKCSWTVGTLFYILVRSKQQNRTSTVVISNSVKMHCALKFVKQD
jgi:hypothetical protein